MIFSAGLMSDFYGVFFSIRTKKGMIGWTKEKKKSLDLTRLCITVRGLRVSIIMMGGYLYIHRKLFKMDGTFAVFSLHFSNPSTGVALLQP